MSLDNSTDNPSETPLSTWKTELFFFFKFVFRTREVLKIMEGEDTGWRWSLEKKGLHQVAEILENYGIDSETDVSLLDRDDLC